jgi:hypothetical protein
MRIIIINDSNDLTAALRRQFADYNPQLEATEYDPEQLGRPEPSFDWNLCDLLVIRERLGGTESGLAWLSVFSLIAIAERRNSWLNCNRFVTA